MRLRRNAGPLPFRVIRLLALLLLLFGIAHLAIFRYSWSSLKPPLPAFGARWLLPSRGHLVPRIEVDDDHPIRGLMRDADHAFQDYHTGRSKTFKQAVDKYRRMYGRHPPPGFDKWYAFARERKVYNIDDFQQIHDDLRPFWAVKPADLRQYAAHAADNNGHGVATISIRNGQVFEGICCAWRSGDFINMLQSIAGYLPDMDIPMNRMDQPRVVVPWEDVQAALGVEESTCTLVGDGFRNDFTTGMTGLWKGKPKSLLSTWLGRLNPFLVRDSQELMHDTPAPKYGWFSHVNKPFMDLASQACPPHSYARNLNSTDHFHQAESSYTHPLGGFITNSNLSSDLCTVGPQLSHLHGLLYASTSMLVTQKLVPIFSECKMSVNNDILFPASIYYKEDDHYHYSEGQDTPWDDKDDVMFWRGSTSGGNAYRDAPEDWHSMHRQRLVLLTNSTTPSKDLPATTTILGLAAHQTKRYTSHPTFHPSPFTSTHTNIAFTNFIACLPNCTFYTSTFSTRPWVPFSENFKHKFLIDVDGHSFSGRWRAYVQSRSLALKATIMREWHDSRLSAWRHYVPVDNRYGDLYSVLTYLVGYDDGTASAGTTSMAAVGIADAGEEGEEGKESTALTIPRHDAEAYRIATQGREWAAQALRKADMEVYLLRLLLEYARLIDDNRDRLGFVGDGAKVMEEVDAKFPAL